MVLKITYRSIHIEGQALLKLGDELGALGPGADDALSRDGCSSQHIVPQVRTLGKRLPTENYAASRTGSPEGG